MSDSATTKAFTLKSVPKLDGFKARFPAPVVNPDTSAPKPGPSDNYLDRLNIDNRNAVSQGTNHVIDFQGNMLPIFMAICFYVSSLYDDLDFKNHAKLSPPTLAAVLLNIVYSFYLVSDLKLRPSPSEHTKFLATPEYIDYQAFLLNLPVPDFLLKFLLAAAPTSDPRRPNIQYIPSFNSFSFDHDFGRYIPSRIFLLCHNYILKNKTNDVAETLLNKMMQLEVCEIDSKKYYIANYFGQQIDSSGSASYNNQLFQAFESIINPALARARSARNVFSRINDECYETSQPNPYEYLIGIDSYNVSEQRTYMESILSAIGSKLGKTTPLGNVISSLSGTSILIHSYSDHAIPTWHGHSTLKTSDSPKSLKPHDYAQAIGFLVKAPTAPTKDYELPADISKSFRPSLLMESGTGTDRPEQSELDIADKNNKNAARPVLRVLDPYDYNATTFKTVFLNGAMLESRGLDGSGVPLPDARLTLDDDNSLFLQSAIPLRTIYRASRFMHGKTSGQFWTEGRVTNSDARQKATSLFYDMSVNRLPSFSKTIIGTPPTVIPGFSLLNYVNQFTAAFNRFGFLTPTHKSDDRAAPDNVDDHTILVWSPYRYDSGIKAETLENRVMMITNLRTIFGTNPPLGEVPHFLDVIPIA